MNQVVTRGVVTTLLSLLVFTPPLSAEPEIIESPYVVQQYAWAFGRMIDSIHVEGNEKVKDIAILREMQLRAGERLDPVALERDQRYLSDRGIFATVDIRVEPVGLDHCELRVVVTQRPTILLKLIYPVLEYDFNTQRIEYGMKWDDRNFRHRLENFSVDYKHDTDNNDSAAIGWFSEWIGWKRIGVGLRTSYFHRNDPPPTVSIIEQSRLTAALSLPLTDNRMAYSQIVGGLAYSTNNFGSLATSGQEVVISPSLGYLRDSRDSRLKPRNGNFFFLNLRASRVLNAGAADYYRVDNNIRVFRPLGPFTVGALYSNVSIQLGEYPEYIRFGLGGTSTLRGYEGSSFKGAHRWFQTAEIRVSPWPKRVYKFPWTGLVDFTLSVVMFVDGGLVWTDASQFAADNYHTGIGAGLRLYSPIQNVIRMDFAINSLGQVRPYFSTGVRF